jgi:hypothetical protein
LYKCVIVAIIDEKKSEITDLCVYNGKQYSQGQIWYDGCNYKCTCDDAYGGIYRCVNRWGACILCNSYLGTELHVHALKGSFELFFKLKGPLIK